MWPKESEAERELHRINTILFTNNLYTNTLKSLREIQVKRKPVDRPALRIIKLFANKNKHDATCKL